MQPSDIFKQLYDYNFWANDKFMNYFQNVPQRDEKALKVFGHLLLAEKTWLQRITGENADNTGTDFWAGETLADCIALFEENRKNFDRFFSDFNEVKLDEIFSYKNSKGAAFENTIGETLMHVFLHSGYHRGQAAQAIRLNGDAPPSTDFIQFLRR